MWVHMCLYMQPCTKQVCVYMYMHTCLMFDLLFCFVFLGKYHCTFQITPAYGKSRVLMIETGKNFSFSTSCILWKQQLSSKDLWTRLLAFWHPRASDISAPLVFPSWGDANSGDSASSSAVAPAVSDICAQLTNMHEARDDVCLRLLPLEQLHLPRVPAILILMTLLLYLPLPKLTWVFRGWAGRWFDGSGMWSPFPILAYYIWRGLGQFHVSFPFLDSLCLQAKLACPDVPEV